MNSGHMIIYSNIPLFYIEMPFKSFEASNSQVFKKRREAFLPKKDYNLT